MDTSKITERMPVFCSKGQQIATVDHLDPGNSIKLTKDEQGQHHWIPLSWVTRVDQHVHLDRDGEQAKQDWMTSAPGSSAGL
jgi:hypothetical protein